MTMLFTWGVYGGYAGWMGRGANPLQVDKADGAQMKALGVVTSTEGGRPNAFNGYDRCVYSIGYIQLCGTTHQASAFLQELKDGYPEVYAPLGDWFADKGLDIIKGKLCLNGRQLLGNEMAQALYGCGGREGDWTPETKERARGFAELISTVLLDPTAMGVQVAFTLRRLLSFFTPEVRELLYPKGLVESGWQGALQAGVLSFAANLPKVACEHYLAYVKAQGGQRVLDPEFVIGALQELTYGPMIAIYPARYDAIRPRIEYLYGVDLPDFASSLQKWRSDFVLPTSAPLPTTTDIQRILVRLGYDLGPKGADGVLGKKTDAAIRQFQASRKLTPDGRVGSQTWAALQAALPSPLSANPRAGSLRGLRSFRWRIECTP